jgi:coenzyme F420-reducing hydrogenase gamma subunit
MQPELTFRAFSLLLIVFLATVLVSLGSCAVIALLAGYLQKTRSLEKVSRSVKAVTDHSPQ